MELLIRLIFHVLFRSGWETGMEFSEIERLASFGDV